MDDQQTTTVDSEDTGAQNAQPAEAEQSTAVQEDVTSDQQSSDEPSGEESTDSTYDEDTLKWMKAKGIDPSSPDALAKATKSAREAEKAMHSKARKASELEKSMGAVSDEIAEQQAEYTGGDPEVLKRLQRMEVKNSVRDFWDNNPEARTYEDQMIDVLKTNPHLAGDLEALYAKALLKSGNAESLKSEGGRKALESLASKQRATAPTGSAVSSSPSSQQITRSEINRRLQSGDMDWYTKNQPKINQLIASGKLQ